MGRLSHYASLFGCHKQVLTLNNCYRLAFRRQTILYRVRSFINFLTIHAKSPLGKSHSHNKVQPFFRFNLTT